MSDLLTQLAEPFKPEHITWKPGHSTKDGAKCMAMAYADLRAYQERLDELCGLDWSVRYLPWSDGRIICELTIAGVTRASTGEMDAQDEKNGMGGTVAEAQAMKRACAQFGLGRYLYDLPSVWVAFDAGSKKISKEGQTELDNRYKAWYAKTIAAMPKPATQDAPKPTQQAQERAEGNKATDTYVVDSGAIDDAELELLEAWKTPADAQAWAVAIGACANIFEAQNSFKNLVNEEFGGKCTTTNIKAVHLAYMRKQDAKLEELFQSEQAQPEQAA